MPIRRRRTVEEVVDAKLSADWHSAIRHPILSPLITFGGFDVSPANVSSAIACVVGWKGAHYRDKIFVFLLASCLWRHSGESFLSNAQYDRLSKHLWSHVDADILNDCGLVYHQAILWDHPAFALKYGRGELELEAYAPAPRKRIKRPRSVFGKPSAKTSNPKPKRRKLAKHKR